MKLFALLTVVIALGGPAMAQEKKSSAPAKQVVKSGSYELILPLGLQADSAYIPEDNPLSQAKIDLGKFLFFDPRLSKDGNVSCASCHNPHHGFADAAATSAGVGFLRGGRNSPTAINRLFSAEQFWDGRAKDLEEQAHGPLTNPIEMSMGSHDDVVKTVAGIPGYAPLFKKAFGSTEVTMPRIAQAIASYERTILAGDSSYDRYQAGQKDSLSTQQIRGLALFEGKADCATCHVSFNFTDETYHNLGVGWNDATARFSDDGLFAVTKKEGDKGRFKTPTLRNVADNPPYMHDGSENTLREVVVFYNQGGRPNPGLDAKMKPLHLNDAEIDAVVAFMQGLTGPVTNAAPPAPGSLPR